MSKSEFDASIRELVPARWIPEEDKQRLSQVKSQGTGVTVHGSGLWGFALKGGMHPMGPPGKEYVSDCAGCGSLAVLAV